MILLRIKRGMERVTGQQARYEGTHNIGLYEAIAISERRDARVFADVVRRECARSSGFAREECEREVENDSDSMARRVRQNSTDSLNGLSALLTALSVIEGPKTLILLSEGLIVDSRLDLDGVIRAAALAQVSINVLMMDVPRGNINVSQLGPTLSEDRDMEMSGLADLAAASRGSLYRIIGDGEGVLTAWPGKCSRTTCSVWSRRRAIATGAPIGSTSRLGGVTSRSGRAVHSCCRRRRRPGAPRKRHCSTP